MTKSEPILNGTDGALPAFAKASAGRCAPNRTLGQAKRKRVGEWTSTRNFCPPSLSAAAEFRASKTGAPPKPLS